MKNYTIKLKHHPGDIFEDSDLKWTNAGYCNVIKRYKIKSIEGTIDKDNINIIYKVELEEKIEDRIIWRYVSKTYTEKDLDKLNKSLEPEFELELQFKYDIGEIVMSSVNGIVPNDPETFKDSTIFCGDIWKIGKHKFIYNGGINLYQGYIEDCVICDKGKIFKENENPRSWEHAERYVCAILELDIDKIVDYKCQEFSKKIWREDYHCMYNRDGSPNMDDYNPKQYRNEFAAVFKYLGVEDKAKELYLKYVEDREEGRKLNSKTKSTKKPRKKKDELDNFIDSLSEKDREKLLNKLMKK